MDVEMIEGIMVLQRIRQVKECLPRLYSFCVNGAIPRELVDAVDELHTWLTHIHPFIPVDTKTKEESV